MPPGPERESSGPRCSISDTRSKSFLDAAGVPETRADRYLAHGRHSIGDRYRHSLKGQLAEDAAKLDSYLNGRAAAVLMLPLAESRPIRMAR